MGTGFNNTEESEVGILDISGRESRCRGTEPKRGNIKKEEGRDKTGEERRESAGGNFF